MMLEMEEPALLIGSPKCTAFSQLMNLNEDKMDEKFLLTNGHNIYLIIFTLSYILRTGLIIVTIVS